jgi:AraC family transcriptional regulator
VHAHQSWTGFTARPGDLSLRAGGEPPSELRWSSLSPVPSDYFVLHLRRDVFARTVEEVTGRAAPDLTLLGRRGFRDPLLTQLGLGLWRELREGAPTGKLYAHCAAQLLTLHLVRHYAAPGEAAAAKGAAATLARPRTLTPQQLHRVIACIQDQPSQDLTLDALAQHTGFSPYHFARLFRQTTGETPHQFVLRLRVEHAQRLLEATGLPVAHVAEECGFADQGAFTRAFRRSLGVPPRAYRRARQLSTFGTKSHERTRRPGALPRNISIKATRRSPRRLTATGSIRWLGANPSLGQPLCRDGQQPPPWLPILLAGVGDAPFERSHAHAHTTRQVVQASLTSNLRSAYVTLSAPATSAGRSYGQRPPSRRS